MNQSVFDHYDQHLGPVYAWMTGDFQAATDRMNQWFGKINLQPVSSALAVDLGCGHGIQAVPLARRGFRVTAVDTCRTLLDQLEANTHGMPVEPVCADLRQFDQHISAPVEAIVCMGDTLTHLASVDEVVEVFGRVADRLEPGGVFCISFRDYATSELVGPARFIPVQSDEQRIQTCFLEYEPDVVHVHDLIATRQDDHWDLSVGVYDKIRLAPATVLEIADNCSLTPLHQSSDRGMGYYAFRSGRS